MKYINEAVSVEARKRVPCRIRWEDRVYRTRQLIDYWILQTRWWGREEKRIYFRLETDRGLIEVYRAVESDRAGISARTKDDASSTPGSGGGAGESGGSSGTAGRKGRKKAAPRPPLPTEGDTHTRERRRTDAVYRPDVRIAEKARRTASGRKTSASSSSRVRWVLSKVLD